MQKVIAELKKFLGEYAPPDLLVAAVPSVHVFKAPPNSSHLPAALVFLFRVEPYSNIRCHMKPKNRKKL